MLLEVVLVLVQAVKAVVDYDRQVAPAQQV
jgi:hypothetical protein